MLLIYITKSFKHKNSKERYKENEKHDLNIAEALQHYDQEVHPKGETLPNMVRVYHVKVVNAFMRAGIPLSKIDVFRELLDHHNSNYYCTRHGKGL